jgi:hypothetical protein
MVKLKDRVRTIVQDPSLNETREITGTITSIYGSCITVKELGVNLYFTVDTDFTSVEKIKKSKTC